MPLYWLCYRHNNQISVVIEVVCVLRTDAGCRRRMQRGCWLSSNETDGFSLPSPASKARSKLASFDHLFGAGEQDHGLWLQKDGLNVPAPCHAVSLIMR